jgi:HlyD family secretion protein
MDRRKVIIPLAAIVALSAIAWYAWGRGTGDGELDASGTVEATEAQLGFQAPGRIERLLVREGDRATAGDTLAVLDRAELLARRAQAQAGLAAAQALLDELEAGSRSEERVQAEQALRAAADRLADATRELERVRRLFETGSVSRETLDRAQLQVDVLTTQREQADQQLRLVRTGPRPERIAAQRAAVAAARAQVAQIDAALTNAVIRAPFDGVITVKHREIGETVGAGAPVLTLMNLDDRWVRIYVPETRVGAVHLGDSAAITADTYPDRTYRGAVSFIASQAEFTPRNVQTREERVKLVYAVKVRITVDSTYDLKPGLPADVRLGN